MNTTILITGASAGIGRAVAQVISKEQPHATLILTGRNLEELNKTKALLSSDQNHRAYQLDVTDINSIHSLKQKLEAEKLTLSGLILNAGIGGENHYGPEDRWDDIIATNLTAPYRLTQELLPFMKANNSAYKHIICLSSLLGRIGIPKYMAYCTSKAGLLGLMKCMAMEYAPDKILVNAICPGWVDTDMSTQGIAAISSATGMTKEQTYDAVMSSVPLKKMAKPEEVADLIGFLINKNQTSITGQAFDINNGSLMP